MRALLLCCILSLTLVAGDDGGWEAEVLLLQALPRAAAGAGAAAAPAPAALLETQAAALFAGLAASAGVSSAAAPASVAVDAFDALYARG